MKKDFMKAMFLMLCAVFTFTFTACSDDDDPADDAATQVAGAYTGTLNVYMEASGDEPVATDTKTITLAKNTENSVNLTIQNFTLAVMGMDVNLGNVLISNCALAGSNGAYSFSGSTELKGVEVPLTETQSATIDCTVNFRNATVDGKTLTLPLTVDDVVLNSLPLNLGITVNFTGTK